MKLLAKIWCFIAGHNMINEYTLNNAQTFEGIARSYWGNHKCMRCGKEHSWQWDMY